jgi:ssDNA-binding Zn-finger/Zn-ribbon topoisomerase 1
MNQVGLTLVTINDLNAAPLDRIISKKFEESQNSGQAKDADVIEPDTDLHKCPFCGGELVERTRKSDGGKFFGCKGYPKCRYTTQELKTLEKAKK